jgi:hypothetical protein
MKITSERLISLLVLFLFTNTGCSVYMAAKQPEAKDLSVLKPGIHRSRVIAELGAPVWSGEKGGAKADVFVFKHGYSGAARTARAVFHGTADVFSLGLWEVISTPTEAYFSGTDMKVEVTYDGKDLVKSTKDLTGNNAELDSNSPGSEEKVESPPAAQYSTDVLPQTSAGESTAPERNEKSGEPET